jgi:endonuclease/exonuclease/phosphatase family metal-dependent hydrolase
MRALTWNVLHRVHAENHGEPAIRHWPDEAARVTAQVALLQALVSRGLTLALLQEVSGELLQQLRRGFPDHAVLDHRHARTPRARGPTRAADPSEHLVVIAPQGAVVVHAGAAPQDLGKGFLAVQVGAWRAISAHVSFGEAATAQLAALRDFIGREPGPLVVGGDFNTDRRTVEAALGLTALRPEAGSAPTRPSPEGGQDIDHLLIRGPQAWASDASSLRVLAHPNLSDHAPAVSSPSSACG